MRDHNEIKHSSVKKIFLYTIVLTLIFVGYESCHDAVTKTKERIQAGFHSIFTGTGDELKNKIARNYQQKSPTGAIQGSDSRLNKSVNAAKHWPVVGWPVEDLSTASGVKYLSGQEKDVILHLNMARTDPPKYAKEFILPRSRYYKGRMYREPWEPPNFAGFVKQEGAEAVYECADVMKHTSPVALLHPSEGITLAARDLAIDQSHTGDTGHAGSDGSNPSARLGRYGQWRIILGENISYGSVSGREIVVGLLVDDGVPGREHRANILNSQFKVVGVSIEKHPVYGYVCVIDFAGGYWER